jgi:hypothetical protein
MADWVNNGSYQDLSNLALKSLAVTSQEGGNMRASNEDAMTAPGSQPVDVMESAGHYFSNDPTIEMTNDTQIKPGTDGKPSARSGSGHAPGAPNWGKTSAPNVVREK